MPFTSWLLQQSNRNDPIGDVARDALQDRDKPTGIRQWRSHLQQLHACDGAKRSLERAYDEYRTSRTTLKK
jgi:hypothetical protein